MRPLFDKKDMEKVKVKRMKDEKCKRILNQILANITFISVLLLNCYINKSSNTFNYQNHIKNTFTTYKDVC